MTNHRAILLIVFAVIVFTRLGHGRQAAMRQDYRRF